MKTTLPGRPWYRITNQADTAEIFLFDEIGAWGTSANDFVKELRDIKASSIDLHINSPGGEVFDGLTIYNAIRNHKARVTTFVDGLAASAASFVAMAGDRIVAERNASLMIHEAHAVGVGSGEDMRRLADLLDRMSGTIANIYSERAGGTTDEWRARMKTETWFSADEAKAAGLVDEVSATPPPKGMPRNTWDLSIFNFAGRDKAPDPFATGGVVEPTGFLVGETGPEVFNLPAGGVIEPVLIAEPDPVETVVTLSPSVKQPAPTVESGVGSVAAVCTCPNCQVDTTPRADLPFDPNQFRDLMRGLVYEAPAPPTSAPRPVDLGPSPAPPVPPPEQPDINPWDQLRAAVRLAANDAPAPPQPNTETENPADEPGFFMDAPAFRTALRRAKL